MKQLEHKPFQISPELRESLRRLDEKSIKVTMAETMSGPDDRWHRIVIEQKGAAE
jgi:hypothetical protein